VAAWWMRWSVLGLRPEVGGSGAAPRRRRLEWPDLEFEIEPGDVPRPASHSDMWALVLLLVVQKALGRWGSLKLGCAGRRPSSASCGSVGVGRRCWRDGAGNPKDLVCILFLFRGCLAFCTDLRILLDRISLVCTYDVLHLSLT
jgi:hypothetical protein